MKLATILTETSHNNIQHYHILEYYSVAGSSLLCLTLVLGCLHYVGPKSGRGCYQNFRKNPNVASFPKSRSMSIIS